jgi:hypothetical protein
MTMYANPRSSKAGLNFLESLQADVRYLAVVLEAGGFSRLKD